MSYHILHIADPHFSRSHFQSLDPERVGTQHAAEVKTALLSCNCFRDPFHALVLSGDFTFGYAPSGFIAASRFVAEVSNLVRPGAMIVIPGNHDVDIGDCLPIGKVSIPVEKGQAERQFRDFLGGLENCARPASRPLSMPLRIENEDEPGPGVVLLGMNSCRVERHDAQGWGYVGIDQIHELASQLVSPGVGGVGAKEGDVVLGITHHNLLPVWDVPLSEAMQVPGQRKVSFTIDSASSLSALSDLGVTALLHGHTHVISKKHVAGYGREDEKLTAVIGAGSLGLSHTSCPEHHVQVLDVDISKKQILVHNLTCEGHHQNHERVWAKDKEERVEISRYWNQERARRALKNMALAAGQARSDWEVCESWSRLRAWGNDARWPDVLSTIHDDVSQLSPSGVSRERIEELIQTLLFFIPPGDGEFWGLTLQEYLLKRL
jgi:3',5'-cyclic AMP phosphodiesterase CpdA